MSVSLRGWALFYILDKRSWLVPILEEGEGEERIGTLLSSCPTQHLHFLTSSKQTLKKSTTLAAELVVPKQSTAEKFQLKPDAFFHDIICNRESNKLFHHSSARRDVIHGGFYF